MPGHRQIINPVPRGRGFLYAKKQKTRPREGTGLVRATLPHPVGAVMGKSLRGEHRVRLIGDHGSELVWITARNPAHLPVVVETRHKDEVHAYLYHGIYSGEPIYRHTPTTN